MVPPFYFTLNWCPCYSLEGTGEVVSKPDLLDHLSSVDREHEENARNLAESARLAAAPHQNGEESARLAAPHHQNGEDSSAHHQNNGDVEKGTLEGNLSEKTSLDSMSLKISCDESSTSLHKANIQR